MGETNQAWYIIGKMQGLHDSNLLICPCPMIGKVNFESEEGIQEIYKTGYLEAYTEGLFRKLVVVPDLKKEITERLIMAKSYTEKIKPKQKIN